MRVRYTPRSRRDLQAIFEFIDARSPGGARAVTRLRLQGVEYAKGNVIFQASNTQSE
jgi:plasmid stabilization system protein ParE